jgi:hypothetical protein
MNGNPDVGGCVGVSFPIVGLEYFSQRSHASLALGAHRQQITVSRR